MRIICISDTHQLHDSVKVPDGDVLIHAGDFMSYGSKNKEIRKFDDWLGTLPHPIKICIAGNHDVLFERKPGIARPLLTNCYYLQDGEYTLPNGWRVWGSPWQPEFCNWAFNLDRGEPLREKWDLIPDGIDILITHGPPSGIMDVTEPFRHYPGGHSGCEELLKKVKALAPKLHVFGHIHSGHGRYWDGKTTYVNASVCDERYNPIYEPIVVDFEGDGNVATD